MPSVISTRASSYKSVNAKVIQGRVVAVIRKGQISNITKSLFHVKVSVYLQDAKHVPKVEVQEVIKHTPTRYCLYSQQVSGSNSPRPHESLQPLPRVSLLQQRWQDDLQQQQLQG